MPTTLEEYLFDLRGYIHLQDAIDRTHVAELNASLDTYLDLEPDAWRGWVYRHPNRGNTRHLHNVFEIGEGPGLSLDAFFVPLWSRMENEM